MVDAMGIGPVVQWFLVTQKFLAEGGVMLEAVSTPNASAPIFCVFPHIASLSWYQGSSILPDLDPVVW